jgi:hypothetical protein
MIRVPRLALYILLVLTQILAPWVHAHTGEETGGFLHVPGLEALADSGRNCTAADMPSSGMDVIVGVQAGLWNRSGLTQFDRQDQPWLPPPVPALSPSNLPAGLAAAEAPPPLLRLPRHDTHPRAPPLHSSLS